MLAVPLAGGRCACRPARRRCRWRRSTPTTSASSPDRPPTSLSLQRALLGRRRHGHADPDRGRRPQLDARPDPARVPRGGARRRALARRRCRTCRTSPARGSPPQQATDPQYWVDHLRHTVRFSDCLQTLLADGPTVLMELGPGHSLSSYARRQAVKPTAAIPALRHPNQEVDDTAYSLQRVRPRVGRRRRRRRRAVRRHWSPPAAPARVPVPQGAPLDRARCRPSLAGAAVAVASEADVGRHRRRPRGSTRPSASPTSPTPSGRRRGSTRALVAPAAAPVGPWIVVGDPGRALRRRACRASCRARSDVVDVTPAPGAGRAGRRPVRRAGRPDRRLRCSRRALAHHRLRRGAGARRRRRRADAPRRRDRGVRPTRVAPRSPPPMRWRSASSARRRASTPTSARCSSTSTRLLMPVSRRGRRRSASCSARRTGSSPVAARGGWCRRQNASGSVRPSRTSPRSAAAATTSSPAVSAASGSPSPSTSPAQHGANLVVVASRPVPSGAQRSEWLAPSRLRRSDEPAHPTARRTGVDRAEGRGRHRRSRRSRLGARRGRRGRASGRPARRRRPRRGRAARPTDRAGDPRGSRVRRRRQGAWRDRTHRRAAPATAPSSWCWCRRRRPCSSPKVRPPTSPPTACSTRWPASHGDSEGDDRSTSACGPSCGVAATAAHRSRLGLEPGTPVDHPVLTEVTRRARRHHPGGRHARPPTTTGSSTSTGPLTGIALLPGTGHLELFLAAAAAAGLADVALASGLAVRAADRARRHAGDGAGLDRRRSRRPVGAAGERWRRRRVAAAQRGPRSSTGIDPRAVLLARCRLGRRARRRRPDGPAGSPSRAGPALGLRRRGVARRRPSPPGDCASPAPYEGELDAWRAHPALVDVATAFGVLAGRARGIAVRTRSPTTTSRATPRCRRRRGSSARRDPSSTPRTSYASTSRITDDAGRVALQIDGLTLRPIDEPTALAVAETSSRRHGAGRRRRRRAWPAARPRRAARDPGCRRRGDARARHGVAGDRVSSRRASSSTASLR